MTLHTIVERAGDEWFPPRFSLALSELLDNPRDLQRSLLYFLAPGHNQGYVIACAVYQPKYSCQTIQKAALSV